MEFDDCDQESQLKWLRDELEAERENVQKAAKIGKHLLEQNEELETRLESMQSDHVSKLQELEQDKYSLSMKLSVKEQIEKTLTGELEQVKESVNNLKEAETYQRQKDTVQARKIQELETKHETLQRESENAGIVEEQLKEKIKYLEDVLEDTKQKLQQKQNVTFDDEELLSLYQENSQLKSEKDSLSLELKHAKDNLQQTIACKVSQEQKIDTLRQEMEELEQQSTSYFNALEKSREEVTDLKVQLDTITMQSVDTNQKGNSLFAEVDDRRRNNEKKLISLKVQHDSLKEQYNIKKQQLLKMKGQIAALLQMSSYQADHAQIQRLQAALMQSRGQVKVLSEKLTSFEHLEAETAVNKEVSEFHKQLSDETLGDKKNVIQFFEEQLKLSKKEMAEVKRELQTQRLLRIEDSDKIWKTEKKLHMTESTMEKMRAENMRLHLKLEELKAKYGENEERAKQPILLGNVEKVPIKGQKKGTGESIRNEKIETCQSQAENNTDDVEVDEVKETKVNKAKNEQEEDSNEINLGCHDNQSNLDDQVLDLEAKDANKITKRVTMCKVVSVLNESGTMSETNIMDDSSEEPQEKTAKVHHNGGSQNNKINRRRASKQCPKVIYSKDALVKNDCKQQ
ncbi:protein Spindly-like [Ptychodera flava]|uniref:protein Spindly-like n=1 Tax=Ptychodera flava TaxID=63121 RepID=UPI00396A3C3F